MKRKVLHTVISVILCLASAALTGCLPLSYLENMDRQGPAMWIVEDKEGHRCYLFGTVNAAKSADMYPFADVIEDAYSYCGYIAVESDVTKPDDGELTDLYKYKDGTTVKDHISSETYAAAVEAIKEYEGGYDGKYDDFTAIYWYSLIYNYNSSLCGYKTEYGSDTYFINKAAGDGKKVVEITGEKKRAEALLSLSDTATDYFIRSALANRGSTALDYYDVIYKEGGTELLARSVNSGKNAQYGSAALNAAMSEYYEIMVVQRNKTLAEAVKKALSDGDRVFFALGISQLVGDDGVVSVLQSGGCRVVRK